MRVVGVIPVVLALAVFAAAPACGQQNVLHAMLLYNYRAPFAAIDDPAHFRSLGASFFANCTIRLGDKICVDLWTLDEKGKYPRQGMSLVNRTDGQVEVRLKGCEIHNGSQTIMVDEAETGRGKPRRTYPFDEVIDAHDSLSVVFVDPLSSTNDSIPGMQQFQNGLRLTCRTATAMPAP